MTVQNYYTHSNPSFQQLNDSELNAFFDDIDRDKDGIITFDELEAKLEEVHQEIAPEPKHHHLHHPERRRLRRNTNPSDPEKGAQARADLEQDGLHAFLRSLMPECGSNLNREEFIRTVRSWNIPSQNQTSEEDQDKRDTEFEHHLPLTRRIKAHWSVEGPKILFVAFVTCLQVAFGVWQMVKYIKSSEARAALGWGVILAKASAGALYPTLFFMILSMSRWFATFMRRFYHFSRVVDWDLSQAFHIWMACVGLVLASLHAIGHLTGTFLYGSRPAQQDNLAIIVGTEAVPKPYVGFVRTLPGWSGIVALGCYWTIALLSIPWIRRWSYEVFQLGHLLLFPMIGLLCAHGTAALLQAPMLGYWLAFPTLLVIIERIHRLVRGCMKITARMEILDDDTVVITCKHPSGKPWRYEAGQYIFLQVPSIAFFQWHPFTISACKEDLLQIHIKTDGNWTGRLRDLPRKKDIYVGIDGPFGAPAQRFYSFDRSIIIGAGVGVTPFSAILTDLEQTLSGEKMDPWRSSGRGRSSRRSSAFGSRKSSRATSRATSRQSSRASSRARSDGDHTPNNAIDNDAVANDKTNPSTNPNRTRPELQNQSLKFDTVSINVPPARRCDFHWMVRDKNYLLWFSSLLNRAHDLSRSLKPTSSLELNITPHITMRRKNISTHVFRYLLDRYRTSTSPYSALTGLRMTSSFGRPDFGQILQDFHSDTVKEIKEGNIDAGVRVGVFFCGSPKIGRILSDECTELTARARADGSRVRYVFMMEVFG